LLSWSTFAETDRNGAITELEERTWGVLCEFSHFWWSWVRSW